MNFSIIIPVYNVASYLRECLDSVSAAVAALNDDVRSKNDEVRGNEPLVEMICVDDGSTDGSGEILDEYKEEVENVGGGGQRTGKFFVIHQKNAGVSAARNAGLKAATGEWILFVDADDLLRDSALVDVARVIAERPETELVRFEKTEFGEEKKRGVDSKWTDIAEADSIDTTAILDLSREIPSEFAAYGLYQFSYRRDLVATVTFRPYIVGEDLLYVCEALVRAKGCLILEKEEYAYRHRPGSVMRTSPSKRKTLDGIAYRLEMFRLLAGSGKRIGHEFWRGRGNSLIESTAVEIFAIHDPDVRRECWRGWLSALSVVRMLGIFSLWQRTVAGIISMTQCKVAAYIFCVLPHRLKRMGLHR